jgi:hypothetical protein
MHPMNTNGMDFELNKTPVNYCSKLPPLVITQTCTPQLHDSKSCQFIENFYGDNDLNFVSIFATASSTMTIDGSL